MTRGAGRQTPASWAAGAFVIVLPARFAGVTNVAGARECQLINKMLSACGESGRLVSEILRNLRRTCVHNFVTVSDWICKPDEWTRRPKMSAGQRRQNNALTLSEWTAGGISHSLPSLHVACHYRPIRGRCQTRKALLLQNKKTTTRVPLFSHQSMKTFWHPFVNVNLLN